MKRLSFYKTSGNKISEGLASYYQHW